MNKPRILLLATAAVALLGGAYWYTATPNPAASVASKTAAPVPVTLAKTNLAKDQAQLAKARSDVERYVALKARGFVSDEKVNDVRIAEAAAAATIKASQAALELSRLQLSYTTLRALFTGIVGARLVFPGSAVKVNDTALAVVNRIQPLYVTFSVPEKHLPELRRAMSAGPMKVLVTLPGSKDQPFAGSAKFIDNTVDATTGTTLMKAVLENRDEKLTAGQFLNVSMTLDNLTDVVLVPAEAIQQGAGGNFLYVAKPDNTVEPRKIEVLATYRSFVAIGQGAAAGKSVVTDGQLRLKPGAQIYGSQKFAVRVQVNPQQLAAHGIGIDEVQQALAQNNVNQPVGQVAGSRQTFAIKDNGQLTNAAVYRPLIVAWRNAAPVRLEEVATLIDSVENSRIASWNVDKRAIVLAVLQ